MVTVRRVHELSFLRQSEGNGRLVQFFSSARDDRDASAGGNFAQHEKSALPSRSDCVFQSSPLQPQTSAYSIQAYTLKYRRWPRGSIVVSKGLRRNEFVESASQDAFSRYT